MIMTAALALAGITGCGQREPQPPHEQFPEVQQESIETALDEVTTELEVQVALLTNLGVEGLRVDTEVVGTDVTLRGQIHDPATPERAFEIVSGLPGVGTVTNDLSLVPVAEKGANEGTLEALQQELADETLEVRVKLRLYGAIGLDAEGIEVEATNGTVTLGGSVEAQAEKTEAVAAAEATGGVMEVVDVIQVAEAVVAEPAP
jgi:osmotically-inducible protein OsmY